MHKNEKKKNLLYANSLIKVCIKEDLYYKNVSFSIQQDICNLNLGYITIECQFIYVSVKCLLIDILNDEYC